MAIEVNDHKIEVIDVHIHAGYEFKEMVHNFDVTGIDKGVVFPRGAFFSDYREANALIAKGMAEFPDRIIGFGRISPGFGKERSEKVFDECMQMKLKGIKLHPIREAFSLDNYELLRPIMEKATQFRVPILSHCGMAAAASPALIADLACEYPEVAFILAHMGYRARADEAIALAKRVNNLYLDTSQVGNIRLLAKAVETLGPEKVLYGSDHPIQPFDFELEKISKHLTKYMNLGNDSLKKILGQNIERLLGLRNGI